MCVFVKKIDTMSFDKEVMESNEPWYLHFADDSCGEMCVKTARELDAAAKVLLSQEKVHFGYVDSSKEKYIINFFGIGGQNIIIYLNGDKPAPAGQPQLFTYSHDKQQFIQFAKIQIDKETQKKIIKGKKNILTIKSLEHMKQTVMPSKDAWFLMFCSEYHHECPQPIAEFIKGCLHLDGVV